MWANLYARQACGRLSARPVGHGGEAQARGAWYDPVGEVFLPVQEASARCEACLAVVFATVGAKKKRECKLAVGHAGDGACTATIPTGVDCSTSFLRYPRVKERPVADEGVRTFVLFHSWIFASYRLRFSMRRWGMVDGGISLSEGAVSPS